MKKINIIILLFIIPNFLWAQSKYDTIEFKTLTLNNKELFTHFNHIEKFVDDTKTRAKVYPYEYAPLPFKNSIPNNIIYTIYTQRLAFSYTEEEPEKIYITQVIPNRKLILKIKKDGYNIIFPRESNLEMLKKLFKNSYYTYLSYDSYQESEREFRLIVKNGNEYALCCLVFDFQRCVEMYLINLDYVGSGSNY